MAKPRTAKLKVYCTPVGFHDAYVAAPSQKAALEAWGAKTNLFAQGAAHLVSDEGLTRAPLQNPGQVIKVLRGSDAEQLGALENTARPKTSSVSLKPPLRGKKVSKRAPKPSRAKLTKAEVGLEALEEQQSKQLREIDEHERRLERQRRDLEERYSKDLDSAKERVASEKEQYERSVRRWADEG